MRRTTKKKRTHTVCVQGKKLDWGLEPAHDTCDARTYVNVPDSQVCTLLPKKSAPTAPLSLQNPRLKSTSIIDTPVRPVSRLGVTIKVGRFHLGRKSVPIHYPLFKRVTGAQSRANQPSRSPRPEGHFTHLSGRPAARHLVAMATRNGDLIAGHPSLSIKNIDLAVRQPPALRGVVPRSGERRLSNMCRNNQ